MGGWLAGWLGDLAKVRIGKIGGHARLIPEESSSPSFCVQLQGVLWARKYGFLGVENFYRFLEDITCHARLKKHILLVLSTIETVAEGVIGLETVPAGSNRTTNERVVCQLTLATLVPWLTSPSPRTSRGKPDVLRAKDLDEPVNQHRLLP